jgi:hypothetical protein
MRRAALVGLTALLSAATSRAQPIVDLGTVVVSMKGTLVRDKQAAGDVGWGGISFGFTGDDVATVRWFGVVHASLFGGNTFDAKSAVFRAHTVPALTVVGPPNLARKLAALPDGTKVQVEGIVDRRTRNILLDVVQALE